MTSTAPPPVSAADTVSAAIEVAQPLSHNPPPVDVGALPGTMDAAVGAAAQAATLLPLWAEVVVAVLVVGGALVALLGSLGLMRLRTYFERVHAPSIIATMGCWLTLWGTIVFFAASGQGLALHVFLIAVFIAVTVPITTIFLMRAALFRARLARQEDVPPSLSRLVPGVTPASLDPTRHQ